MYSFDNERLLEEVVERVEKVKGPSAKGWYRGRCPFPGHRDGNASFGFTATGYHCQGCGRQGSLRQLADELGLLLPRPASQADRAERLTAADGMSRLRERGVRDETIAHFAIEASENKQAWRIRIGSGAKLKAFDPGVKAKYYWDGGKPATGAEVYNLAAC